ncbi:HEAT repeat domain-containing protein [Hymenobacter rubripertinctus]
MMTSLSAISKTLFSKIDADLTTSDVLSALSDFIHPNWITEFINHELEKLNENSSYIPTSSSYSSIEVMNNDLFDLHLGYAKNEDLKKIILLTSSSSDKIIISFCKFGLLYNLYNQQNPYPIDVLDKNKKLSLIKGNHKLNFMEAITIKKYEEIFSHIGSTDNDDIIIVSVTIKEPISFSWEYDAHTLRPIRLVGGGIASRIEHTCKLLGELDAETSVPILETLLHHPMHNVRWEAARSIMMIDFEKGIESLHMLKDDKHIEIRESAHIALTQLNLI